MAHSRWRGDDAVLYATAPMRCAGRSPALPLPFCDRLGIPMVYDVHHHRCNPDALDLSEASALAVATWNDPEVLVLRDAVALHR